MTWRTPITLVVLLVVLLGAALYGWQTIISPAREDDENAEPTSTCENKTEFRKGQVIRSEDILVNVYNAGNRVGLAGETLASLVKRGFAEGEAANASDDVKATNVSVVGDRKSPDVRLVAAQFKGSVKYLKDDEQTEGIDVVVGDKFQGVRKSATKKIKLKQDVEVCATTTDSDSAAT